MHRRESKPTVSATTVLIVVISIAVATRCSSIAEATIDFHASDCMRNPFASGCRGISAKRSVRTSAPTDWILASDNGDTDDGLYQRLATNFVHSLAMVPPTRSPVAKTRQARAFAEARQLLAAIESFVESASSLVSLCAENQVAQSSLGARRTSCRELFAPQAGPLGLRKPKADGTAQAGSGMTLRIEQEQAPGFGRERGE